MPPVRVGEKDVLKIFLRAKQKQDRLPTTKPKFIVGHNVRFSKQKMNFAKASEQIFSTEIFKIITVIRRNPRPVYELEDLNSTHIEGQLYQEELVPFRISKCSLQNI
jgi:hypothetical protein